MAKYVGKRIVPLPCGEWDQRKEYEMLSVVLESSSGDSYIARRQVPAGTAITDTSYWAKSSDFSQQDRKSTRLNSSHPTTSRMPSSA